MSDKEFNLLDEKWIKVMTKDCRIREVSLKDALLYAHEYVRLSGELPTQDVAVMRLLLAVLHTIFSRVDENGNESSLYEMDDIDASLERWAALWNLKKFPEKPIVDYLEKWRDRFWLFHPERPFWQVPYFDKLDKESVKEYPSAKLNGEILESKNKKSIRLFSGISGDEKLYLNYDEAARWLLYLNAYDDTGGKTETKDVAPLKCGWLGALGLVYLKGGSLFETLMLNLVMLKDGQSVWKEDNKPIWEEDRVRNRERSEIIIPENQAQLLTIQSRRILLTRENGKVKGFRPLGGDFFDINDSFAEQMTAWRQMPSKKGEPIHYQPKRHDSSRQMWRDFGNLFVKSNSEHKPGIVMWYLKVAEYMQWPENNVINFIMTSVSYDKKGSSVNDSFSDSISFCSGLISSMRKGWQKIIIDQIDKCDHVADQIMYLYKAIIKAEGGNKQKNNSKIIFYYEIDGPFRKWLRSVDPSTSGIEAKAKINEWNRKLRYIALNLGKDIVRSSGQVAFIGRKFTEKINGKEVNRYYCSPDAYEKFELNIKKLTKMEE